MITLLIILSILSYFIMQSIELVSFGSRIAGRLSSNLALGTTVHHTIYVASRALLIPLLPMLAFLVDSDITIKQYLFLVTMALLTAFLLLILVLIKFNFFKIFFQLVFKNYSDKTLPIAIFKSVFVPRKNDDNLICCKNFSTELLNLKKVFFSFIAYFFLVNSFLIAFLLTIIYPEYQLTLSQSTSFFHGIGAIFLAFYLDPMLSRSIYNSNDNLTWIINSYSIFFGRVLSYATSCISFLALYFIM